jgi:hypothetical protein
MGRLAEVPPEGHAGTPRLEPDRSPGRPAGDADLDDVGSLPVVDDGDVPHDTDLERRRTPADRDHVEGPPPEPLEALCAVEQPVDLGAGLQPVLPCRETSDHDLDGRPD